MKNLYVSLICTILLMNNPGFYDIDALKIGAALFFTLAGIEYGLKIYKHGGK